MYSIGTNQSIDQHEVYNIRMRQLQKKRTEDLIHAQELANK